MNAFRRNLKHASISPAEVATGSAVHPADGEEAASHPGSPFLPEHAGQETGRDTTPQADHDDGADRAAERSLLAEAVAAWRESLAQQVGASTLADVTLLGDATIDLSAAHPGGVAQLYAGRTTRLSNLVRDNTQLPIASRRARTVQARSAEQAGRYGLAPTYLAIGLATWVEAPPAPPAEPISDEVMAEFEQRILAGTSQATPDDGPATPAAEAVTPDLAVQPAAAQAAVEHPPTQSLPLVTQADLKPSAETTGGLDPLDPRSAAPGQPRTLRAPLLLRPVMLTPQGDDFELTLEHAAMINPVVARALHGKGVFFDPLTLAESAFTSGSFDPRGVLDFFASLGREQLEGYEQEAAVLVASFVHPGQALVEDLDELAPGLASHEVVAALAGVPEAKAALQALQLPPMLNSDPLPAFERGVGDLDRHSRYLLDALATGGHLYVDAPVGSDVPGAVAAAVAEAAAAGRSVLYVTGHRRAADSLQSRLAALDLDDLVLDTPPLPTWRHTVTSRLLTAMAAEAEPYDEAGVTSLRENLLAARTALAEYIGALHAPRQPWGVSAYDALQALALLTSQHPTPATEVRLPVSVAVELGEERRAHLADRLTVAAELGAFDASAAQNAWTGAEVPTAGAAAKALQRVTRLLQTTLPQLRRHQLVVTEVTGLPQATTVAAFGDQLQMLASMRATLDLFHPMVFERSAVDLVEATAPRKDRQGGPKPGFFATRRLRKRAKELVRPGVRLPNLHAALREVLSQQQVWTRQVTRGGWPTLPEGLGQITDTHQAVAIDLAALDAALAGTARGADLLQREFGDLLNHLEALQRDAAALADLPTRTTALGEVHAAGLSGLVSDLGQRQVRAPVVAAELELAWWGTVFEHLLAADPALVDQTGPSLGALARRFRELDRQHVASLSAPVRAAVRAHLGVALRDHRDSAERLFATLIEGGLTTLRDLMHRHGEIVRRLRPVLVATPTLVPHLLTSARQVDLLVLDAVQHVPLESLVPAIARARQVVVLGDLPSASGTAVAALASILPQVRLAAGGSPRDAELPRLLASHGYSASLHPAPLPKAAAMMRFHQVEGIGMPAASGMVETSPAEVDRVVELAIEHALDRPRETFGIVTVTATHAERIREALLAEVRANPALAPFFSSTRPEPVIVADITGVAGLTRDEILFTPGLGRTPHGRVLHRFGPLAEPGGQALLLGALGATRRRLTVVSAFSGADLDETRLHGEGPKLFRELLLLAEARSGVIEPVLREPSCAFAQPSVDRLLVDLGERLWRLGYLVETDFGLPDGGRLPLVIGHPDLPDEMLVAVTTDDDAYVAEPSIRVRDRQRAERLEHLGWTVAHVWSAAAFLDPDGEAERLRRLTQRVRDLRLGDVGSPVAPRDVPDVDDEGLPHPAEGAAADTAGDEPAPVEPTQGAAEETMADPAAPSPAAEDTGPDAETGPDGETVSDGDTGPGGGEETPPTKSPRRAVRPGKETASIAGLPRDERDALPETNDHRLAEDVPPHWGKG
ncbi:MAG: hypothetical protein FWG11_02455 [Promicromonosporaceae bacterium]|nr:hypothetical protein [Promicromonosporaceae bacterium]